MKTVIVQKFAEPSFNRKEILRYAACKAADENVLALLDECLKELKGNLTYKVCYIELSKKEVFLNVSSSLLDGYLADCENFILFAATVGIEIDRLITKYSHVSPAKAHMFQSIGAERIEALCDLFSNDIKSQYGNVKPRISPGYSDLPLEVQREVFNILDCSRKIGLVLNDSMLMSPTKSVTALIGVLK